jgi:AcrR family transcriptional regulator
MATPDETRDLLIRAVMELLPDHPADVLSVRDIAQRAGVNHGLVHRYFGSKEALVREALSRTSAQVHAVDPFERGMTAWSWALVRERPELARVLARMCLDGPKDLLAHAAPPPERIDAFVAPVRALLERAGLAGQVDPYLLNALGCATLLGWAIFRPLLDAGWKVPPDADEQLARLAPLVDALMAGYGADDPVL